MMGRRAVFVAVMLCACQRPSLRDGDAGMDSLCGNGVIDPGEVCDDGNTVSGDGCSSDCKSDETCGNGIIDPGEVCDDGNNIDCDGCSSDCKSDETCGNGVVDKCKGETCDDGNTMSGDGCSANCQSNETCGNGIVDPGEQCDPGGNIFTSTCNPDCTKARCGDGEVNMPAGEQCDDGNTSNNDACTDACKNAVCGDGFVYTGHEQCDDGNTNNNDGCRNDCTLGPGNDFKTTAQDITGGGTFIESMANAKDDFHSSCSDQGGKDVFFTFTISKTEIVYFDTFNSDFDSSIAVYPGACTAVNNNNTIDCNDDTTCGDGSWSQDAVELDPGQYCLVVDYADHTDIHNHLVLTMREGGRDGDALQFDGSGSGSVSDDLSMATNVTTADAACGATPGPDLGYYLLGCDFSFTLDASTCGTSFDTGLYLREGNANNTTDIACNDDDPTCGMASTISGTITKPDLYWVIVDSYADSTPGPFTLTYMVQ